MIVRQFVDWMETAPPGRRAEAAHALARAYLYSDLDEETRSGMEAAMTLLLDDVAPEVRLSLSDALGSSPDAPRHIIIALSQDQPAIAKTVLARSPVFIDAELVDIVAVADDALQMAVAARPAISGAVAAALTEVGSRRACHVLVANPMAALLPSALRRVASRMGDDPVIRDALLRRDELPADVHQLLIRQLADALGGVLVQMGWVAPDRARRATREACDGATIAIAANARAASIVDLVDHMRRSGQLTTEFLLRSVCYGRLEIFEAALANLTGSPLARVAGLVRAGRRSAFRAIYAKARLPDSAFEAFVAATEAWRQIGEDGPSGDLYGTTMRVINAVMARYARRTGGDMTDMAAVLRRFAADQARDAARDFTRPARKGVVVLPRRRAA